MSYHITNFIFSNKISKNLFINKRKFINDNDIVKPDGYKFESLGYVRDGSEITDTKNVFKKGYHVTEATVLTHNNQPLSIFSRIHSSREKNFTSINNITFQAMERAKKLLHSKEDVISVAKLYFSRWRIEKYSRCKKQVFGFENFRVRNLKAINS